MMKSLFVYLAATSVILVTNAQTPSCDTVNCFNGKCEMINNLPKCVCTTGFLNSILDDTICIDIDECINGTTCRPGGRCVNLPGRYYCMCYAGYQPVDAASTSCINPYMLYYQRSPYMSPWWSRMMRMMSPMMQMGSPMMQMGSPMMQMFSPMTQMNSMMQMRWMMEMMD
ncbi:latent-transforming growth factor beta-binding protein 2-like [Gigantopelta aegis]|uniref:latent-transforming growth factor beta-binding protein 2-like n=1 Tax=Gigantopelta aegis TaxID=1735272 RepID=UPI001B88E523|nr:latent-transforming growth factor beta-binding protein 2-like [Gigantopelta aegis]XP_041367512.1 latent-transforming growth factor beta-binding protein 2-like [Gigantopelta aegis]XP_041367514.1 latent-transforming growth factor beta-binding protein 2-like [Gigantopelta aegis]XP_041367515.1 latent-transforming growth factor beta-binding protein 2-like [Gigantopelta aegis]